MSRIETQTQVIWRVDGDTSELVDRLGLDYPDENPLMRIHAGQGTLREAQRQSELMKLLLTPDDLPEPLIALAPVDVFGEAEVYPSDAPGLLVSETFVQAFWGELEASCKVYPVVPVLLDTPEVFSATREELLDQALHHVRLFLVNPLTRIGVKTPTISEDLLFVPGDVGLPPFFRASWRKAAVFIRDDVRRRITRDGFRGVQYNLDPGPLN